MFIKNKLNKNSEWMVEVMTEIEIEKSMERAIKKLPLEIKKIKLVLSIIKFFKKK